MISDDGSWKWFPVGIIDLPFSNWIKQIAFVPPFWAFLIFGTIWWYCVSLVIRFFWIVTGNDNSK